MSLPFSFEGATTIITGGGSGIGRACALEFGRRGSNVVVADLREDRAQQVAAEVGDRAVGVQADASSEADLITLRDKALGEFGRLDLIMNNAGLLAMGAPESLPDEAWQRSIELNVMALARSNRVFLPLLIEQGRGHVVNTASASGVLAYGFDRLPYVATKHAVVGITEALALYLTPKGIGVTCFCPSGVRTNVMEGVVAYGSADAKPRAPQHRLSTAEEAGVIVADAVADGRFFVTTAPEIHAELAAKAADRDAFLRAQL